VRNYYYDKLSRLTSVVTPEVGVTVSGTTYYCTTWYSYDWNGNVIAKAAPKPNQTNCPTGSADTTNGVVTCYGTWNGSSCDGKGYDALNRPTKRTYSDGKTPSVAYSYDQSGCLGAPSPCYNTGRRTGMTDGSGQTAWSYDSMGRVLIEHRTIGSVTNNILYTYNLDGSIATLTYPSGRTITYTVSAVGRPQKAVDTANSINYALNATYAPQGAVAGAVFGQSGTFGGITYSATYNNRLSPYTASATSSGGNALNLTFAYFANGNVETITNNLNSNRTESLTYDNLNRISTAHSQATSGSYCWGQSFGYDRYANLTSMTNTGTGSGCQALYSPSLSVNTKNQISNSGFTYDASGDLTSDGTYTYAWDARPLLQSAGGVTYTYDGDGKRVMKSSGTLYWNYPNGTPLAETNSSGSTLNEYIFFGGARIARRDSSGNVYYYFQDHLGTAKTITKSTGVVCYDADFTPFGSEMAYTNSCAQNYKFTGLERDSETALDHTPNRKYESNLGRWLSPDPLALGFTNPQSLNRYAYTLNNPTTLTDLLGLCPKGTHRVDLSGAAAANRGIPYGGPGVQVNGQGQPVSMDCTGLVGASIAANDPGFKQNSVTRAQIQNGEGVFNPVNSPQVGDVALIDLGPGHTPYGHVVVVSGVTQGLVSAFIGANGSCPNGQCHGSVQSVTTASSKWSYYSQAFNPTGASPPLYAEVCLPNTVAAQSGGGGGYDLYPWDPFDLLGPGGGDEVSGPGPIEGTPPDDEESGDNGELATSTITGWSPCPGDDPTWCLC
jgi:RHS repeat-associated protein